MATTWLMLPRNNDSLLRRNGFVIHSRPARGWATWLFKRTGEILREDEAVKACEERRGGRTCCFNSTPPTILANLES
jgi:hypothetical protein